VSKTDYIILLRFLLSAEREMMGVKLRQFSQIVFRWSMKCGPQKDVTCSAKRNNTGCMLPTKCFGDIFERTVEYINVK